MDFDTIPTTIKVGEMMTIWASANLNNLLYTSFAKVYFGIADSSDSNRAETTNIVTLIQELNTVQKEADNSNLATLSNLSMSSYTDY